MPDSLSLPLFPLSLVAFPGEVVNLHIFEPRYRQLFQECELTGGTFGIIPVVDGKMVGVGTEMRLQKIAQRYDDGKMDVATVGLQTFILKEYKSELLDKMYPGGTVNMLPFDTTQDDFATIQICDLVARLYEHMSITNVPIPQPTSFDLSTIVHKIGLSIEQEVELLKLTSKADQHRYLLEHLKVFVPHVIEMEELRRKAALNGHFKNVIPPKI